MWIAFNLLFPLTRQTFLVVGLLHGRCDTLSALLSTVSLEKKIKFLFLAKWKIRSLKSFYYKQGNMLDKNLRNIILNAWMILQENEGNLQSPGWSSESICSRGREGRQDTGPAESWSGVF